LDLGFRGGAPGCLVVIPEREVADFTVLFHDLLFEQQPDS
jgi:hypothetical protein